MQELKPGQVYKDSHSLFMKVFYQVEGGVFATGRWDDILTAKGTLNVCFFTDEQTKDWVPVDESGLEIKEKWVPKEGDAVWFFIEDGRTGCTTYFDRPYFRARLENGFLFPTEQAALEAFERVKKLLNEM